MEKTFAEMLSANHLITWLLYYSNTINNNKKINNNNKIILIIKNYYLNFLMNLVDFKLI